MERNKIQEIVCRNINLEIKLRKYIFYECLYVIFYHMLGFSLNIFLADLVTSNFFSELLGGVLWPTMQRTSC